MAIWVYVCALCGWGQQEGKVTTIPFCTLRKLGKFALSAGAEQPRRPRVWLAEWRRGFSPHQPPHPVSWRREQPGRGGGHCGRPGSPFSLFFAVQAPSDRIQSEKYPNRCSLMVSKCHDSREVNGSGYCTGSRGLLWFSPWGLEHVCPNRSTPTPPLALSSSHGPGLSSSTCSLVVEKHSLEFRVAHCCHGSSHSLHFCWNDSWPGGCGVETRQR